MTGRARLALGLALALLSAGSAARDAAADLRPYAGNPFYWEYRGAPVLLLGASVVDNLHHWHELEAHLDALQAAGVNYLRVSLSMGTRAVHGGDDRPLPHDQPFLRLPSGRYDLAQWDPVWWDRLDRLLRLSAERGMIIELELWNRFDFWRGMWEANAWNPRRNVTYTEAETGLGPRYLQHPVEDAQPFFHSLPGMADRPVLLAYQQAFVDRVLDLTLGHDHVLYTINNETTTDPAWGRHWIAHVKARARAAGREVFVTDMFDAHALSRDPFQRQVVDHPEIYDFVSAAQVTNLRSSAAEQASQLAWLRQELAAAPRPFTISKVYGSDIHRLTDFRRRTFQRYGDRAAVHSFWMSLLGGASAVRFHRENAGLGPAPRALAAIRAARLMEALAPPWAMAPADDLLAGNGHATVGAEETALGAAFTLPEAHAMADPGRAYAVFFTRGGSVELRLETDGHGAFDLRWIDVERGTLGPTATVSARDRIPLRAPGEGPWLAVLTDARVTEADPSWRAAEAMR